MLSPMTLDERIEILKAIKDGKTIEYTRKSGEGKVWTEVRKDSGVYTLGQFYDDSIYRVKKEPRRYFVNIYKHEIATHTSREYADSCASYNRLECIEVVEVIKE